jgi:hypothetical protein
MFIAPTSHKPLARFGRADNQVAIFQDKLMSARPNREAWVWCGGL